jgi:hypothetical protein
VAFVQKALGCGCPVEIIRTGWLSGPARPLRDYLARESATTGWEALIPRLGGLLGLSPETAWLGQTAPLPPLPPWNWRPEHLQGHPHGEGLARLKHLCAARCGLLIDVPGRALFVVATSLKRPATPRRLADLHAAASLVKELGGYNRVRLFTLSSASPARPRPVGPPVLDAALTWEAVISLLREQGASKAAAGLAALLNASK